MCVPCSLITRRVSRLVTGLATYVVAGVVAAIPMTAPAHGATPEKRSIGLFEISMHVKRVGDSGRWLRTGNPFGSYQVREYSVRWNGRKLSIPGMGERFWQALHLPRAPHPTLLLTNGPNLQLVSDVAGRLEMRALAPESGNSQLQWLDADGGQPGKSFPGYAHDRIEAAPRTELTGGRFLYVRNRLVLDVDTLQTVTVEPWAREGEGEAVVEMNASNSPASSFSPGRTRFVLVGEGRDYRRGGERFDLLMLVDLGTGKAEGLRLDRLRTPYGQAGDIDATWVERHFRWERDTQGREVLRPR